VVARRPENAVQLNLFPVSLMSSSRNSNNPSPCRSQSRPTPRSLENAPSDPSLGHFVVYTSQQGKQIQEIDHYIRRKILPIDEKFGYEYVARQKNTHFCKVGLSEKNPETRCEAIKEDCQMVTEATYVMPRFRHAFRAERMVHSIIYHWANQKAIPSVRTKNSISFGTMRRFFRFRLSTVGS